MKLDKNSFKPLLTIGIDYIRWTQLTPMIMVWGAVLLLLLAMVFVNFQDQALSTTETVLNNLYQLPLIGDRLQQYFTAQTGDHHITTADVKSWIFSIWSIASLVFMLMSFFMSYVRTPGKSWTLRKKLFIVFTAVLILLSGFVANYYAEPSNFKGGTGGWILNFSLLSLMVFIVSSYSLSVSHFLNHLNHKFIE